MAVFRLYADVLTFLHQQTEAMHTSPLEEITAAHSHFAYYGARKTLAATVRNRARALEPMQNVDATVAEWYGTQAWEKDSGSFPDCVLEYGSIGLLGDGAIIELKDSRGDQIASFNSTLPERSKDLSSLSAGVRKAVEWYQQKRGNPIDLSQPNPRDCFYTVRTWGNKVEEVRISLVEGSFFETITTQELLRLLWLELIREAGLDTSKENVRTVVQGLSRLSRDQIAKTRRIKNASIKPRLRVMAEVEPEGNPHTYPEIQPRSVNLIFQHGDCGADNELEIIANMFQKDGVPNVNAERCGTALEVQCVTVKLLHLQHKRNGKYTVLQSIVPR